MATPFVAGVSLLMRDANPSLTPQQIKDAIDVDRGGLGPAGRRRRLRRRPARRLRRAARDRRARPRHDRRGGADAHVPQRHALGHGREHRHHPQRHRHAVPDRGDDDRVERHGARRRRRRTSTSRCSTRRARTVASATTSNRQDALSFRPSVDGHLHAARELGERQRPVLRRHLGRDRRGLAAPPRRLLRRRLRRHRRRLRARRRSTPRSARARRRTVASRWTRPSSNGGSAITGYKVYRGTSSGGETLLGERRQRHDAAPTRPSPAGTTYYYKVTAVNAVGEGALSNERSATPADRARRARRSNSATAGNGLRRARLERARRTAAPRSRATGSTAAPSSGNETLLDDARHRHELQRQRRQQRHDLLLRGRRDERRRRGRPVERALGHAGRAAGYDGAVEAERHRPARRRHEPAGDRLVGVDRQRRRDRLRGLPRRRARRHRDDDLLPRLGPRGQHVVQLPGARDRRGRQSLDRLEQHQPADRVADDELRRARSPASSSTRAARATATRSRRSRRRAARRSRTTRTTRASGRSRT